MLQKSSWLAALSLGMNMYSESKEGSLAELTQQTVLPLAPAQMLSNWADDSVKRQEKAAEISSDLYCTLPSHFQGIFDLTQEERLHFHFRRGSTLD